MNQAPSFAVDQVLNASGLECPLPILKTKATLARMQPGEVLRVIATDRHAPVDFKVYCMRSGDELLVLEEGAEQIEIVLRKAAAQGH